MPSRPVQSLANGFLTLLGVKNLGKLPDTLLDNIHPTLEMSKWYLESNAVNGFVPSAYVAPYTGDFSITNLTVPEGQLWYVHSCTVTIVGPAAPGTWNVIGLQSAAHFVNPRHSLAAEPVTYQSTTPPASVIYLRAPSLRDFWAPAGTQIGASVGYASVTDSGATEGWTAQFGARYTPLVV